MTINHTSSVYLLICAALIDLQAYREEAYLIITKGNIILNSIAHHTQYSSTRVEQT